MLSLSFRLKNNKVFYINPARLIVLSFVLLIVLGTFLLNLPIASKDGKSIGILGALFTSTSASCVTGLVYRDTLTQWSYFGQIVILSLIQIGGLGIITLTMFLSVLLGKKISLKGRVLVQESLNYFSFEGAIKLLKKVFLITISIETLGTLILSISFIPQFGIRGLYMGVFHSISAFCNAGFDIMGDYKSLTCYNSNPLILFTIAALIITGGLGFIVWEDLIDYRKKRTMMLHTKLVLITSAILIIGGSILFFVFEYNNPKTTGNFGLFEKINSSIFHSVSTRTAGMNSLPLDSMKEISKAATVFLMFIGGAPGSTAGGIKVTTFAIILIAIISQAKGSPSIVAFKQSISFNTVLRALSIIGLAAIWVLFVTTIILAIEGDRYSFINILYEATSAFGTVGLSAAGTPDLHSMSKILLMITMFIGRVGPVSFVIAIIINNSNKSDKTVFPESKIIVG